VSPENKKPKKIPEIHFRPEGYTPTNSIEFLEQLTELLHERRIDPDQLVYSGMGSTHLYGPDGSIKRPNAIFAMNESGWVRAAHRHENTPADYAAGSHNPRIALYDRSQLAHAYSYDTQQDEDDYFAPIVLSDIVPGDTLARSGSTISAKISVKPRE
jgi:hypothetical protein